MLIAESVKKARDIIFEYEKISPVTDYFVIATCNNKIQAQAVADK